MSAGWSRGPSPRSVDTPSSSEVGSLSGCSSVSGLSSMGVAYPCARNSNVLGAVREGMAFAGTVARMEAEPEDAQRLATAARDRVRFEEDALGLADQVYRVA